MAYLIGVDIGTSSTKSVLFNLKGETIASHSVEYPLYQPHIGWAEQEPEDWWRGTYESINAVLKSSNVNADDIKGIGLSGQMHGMVLLDKENKVLRKSIIWCDQRTAKECREITSIIGKKRLIEITANPALTGFTASKIMWVKNNQPEIFEKINKILLPKDYIRYMLTGEFATEVSDASGMQLLDVPKREWSREVISKLGFEYSWFAKMHESYEISGMITNKAAKLTGLKVGTPVAGGGGDQAAGAVGNGIVKEGVISATLGTSGVVFAHSDNVSIDPLGRVHTFCHAVPDCWHIMGVTQGAGLSYRWIRDEMCESEMAVAKRLNIDPYVIMGQQADQIEAGSKGLIYLPYMMGERTPHLDPDAKGVFFGLSAIHDKRYMIRSVMEGVSYSLLDCLNIIRELGVNASEIRSSGGGSKSKLWRQIQADMFNTDICTLNSSEGGALGVAILAGVGIGEFSSVPEACEAIIKRDTIQKPDAYANKIYTKYYKVYKQLYTALKPSFDDVRAIIES